MFGQKQEQNMKELEKQFIMKELEKPLVWCLEKNEGETVTRNVLSFSVFESGCVTHPKP